MAKARPLEGDITDRDREKFFERTIQGPMFDTGTDRVSHCLIWIAANKEVWGGALYGVFAWNGRTCSAHRFAYYMGYGVDPGPSTDHLCHVTLCVNAEHLLGCSIAENNRNKLESLREFCRNGHVRTEANTYIWPDGNQRGCRECMLQSERARRNPDYSPVWPERPHTADPGLSPAELKAFIKQYKRSFHFVTVCKRGHTYTEANTRFDTKGGKMCRDCDKVRNAERLEYKTQWLRDKTKRLRE